MKYNNGSYHKALKICLGVMGDLLTRRDSELEFTYPDLNAH